MDRLDKNSQGYLALVNQHNIEIAVAQAQDRMFMNLLNGGFTASNTDVQVKSSQAVIDGLYELKKRMDLVAADTDFVRRVYSRSKSVKNVKQNKEQKKMELMNSILATGKKGRGN